VSARPLRIAGHGISVELPAGWEGRIYRRPGGRPVLHAASFPLPAEDGDFATDAIRRMPPGGALAVLTEYDPALAGRGLFAPAGPPAFRAAELSPAALLQRLPGRLGGQRFFSSGGRAFCLYTVVARRPARALAVGALSDVLASLRLEARSA
jgi:hypothetical protein